MQLVTWFCDFLLVKTILSFVFLLRTKTQVLILYNEVLMKLLHSFILGFSLKAGFHWRINIGNIRNQLLL